MNTFNKFFLEYNGIISLCSVLASMAGAFFGYKAYRTAKDIFKKGIQIDKDRVLQQLGLEFFVNFIKGFDQFLLDVNFMQKRDFYFDNKVGELAQVLNKNNFTVDFSYFEKHKGEIWVALSETLNEENKKQAEEFESICRFIELSRKLSNGMNYTRNDLQKYIDSNHINSANVTLAEYYDSLKSSERKKFDEGIKLIEIVKNSIQYLPSSLKIEEIRKKDNK